MTDKAPKKRPARPTDANQLGKLVVDLSVGEAEEHPHKNETKAGKNPAAVELGRLGGLKGGTARAKSLPEEERKKIATAAAKARWSKRRSQEPRESD
jgi:hypothetical protein